MGKVLVVDDHPDTCRMMVRMVQIVGGEADCVLSGADALEYLRTRPVKLVLLDYTMPEMDGLEVLRRLRQDERTAHVPVVLCTAAPDQPLLRAAMDLGAAALLPKREIGPDKVRPYVERFALNN